MEYFARHSFSSYTQGSLRFYLAIFNTQLKRQQVARPHFLTAQTELCKMAKPDNALFQTIEKGLAETKP